MINNKYTVLIIDDESICIDNLQKSLNGFPELILTGTAQTPEKGKSLLLEQRPDLLFLDVELPGQTGMELLNELRERINWPLEVIFYTAYDKYLLDALRSSALDYLLKPYEEEAFQLVINRFFREIPKEHAQSTLKDALSKLISQNRTFLIATITGYQMLRLEQIGYFEYRKESKQWWVFLTDNCTLRLKSNTRAEDILKYSSTFIQINQKAIINLDYLSTIHGKNCRLLPPFDGANSLDISRIFLKSMQEKFDLI